MLTSYHAEPKKPEKSTKIDHGQDREKKEISNIEKKDRGSGSGSQKDDKPKKH